MSDNLVTKDTRHSGAKRRSERISVVLEHETAGAVLVRASDGRKAWLKKGWYMIRESTVGSGTFDREAKRYDAGFGSRSPMAEFKEAYHRPSVLSETSKAIKCQCVVGRVDGRGRCVSYEFWMPKSQCDAECRVPGWLLVAKVQDLVDNLQFGKSDYRLEVRCVTGLDMPGKLIARVEC